MSSFTRRTDTNHCLNVILAGKGGQGVVLAGHILLRSCLLKGLSAKRSEVHGMAQRGGSVVVHIRIGEQVHSPVIPYGQAHFIMGIDENEGRRWTPFLLPEGRLITLSSAELEKLPETRFKNMATLGRFFAELQSSTLFQSTLKTVLKSLSARDIERILQEKMSATLVADNIRIFETYFTTSSTPA